MNLTMDLQSKVNLSVANTSRVFTNGNNLIKTTINYYGLIYTVFLFLIGIPGNVTVFFVYSKKLRKNSTTIFVLVLAVFDLVNCIATLPTEIAMLLNPFIFRIGPICKMTRFTTFTCNSAAAVILAAIAVDRYKRVCRPHGTQITLRRAKRMAFLALFISVSFTWPSLVIYGPRTLLINTIDRNLSLQICEIDDSFVLTVYPLAYYAYMCFSTCGIYALLLGCYICIVIKMVKRRKFVSLISRRSVSTRDIPDIHIEQPTTFCPQTKEVQVTSFHSSTRSLNICCRTDDSNNFQYGQTSENDNKSLNRQADIKVITQNGFLHVNGLISYEKTKVKEENVNSVNLCEEKQYDIETQAIETHESIPCEMKKKENDNKDGGVKSQDKCLCSGKCDKSVCHQRSSLLKTPSLENPSPDPSDMKKDEPKQSYPNSMCESTTTRRILAKSKSISTPNQSQSGESLQNGSSKSRMRPSKRSLRTHRLGKTTLMLLVVTMVYIISFLPFLGVVIHRSIFPEFPLTFTGEFNTIYEALYRSYLLNCAVNPLIYSFCNANFRKDCRAACRRRKLFNR